MKSQQSRWHVLVSYLKAACTDEALADKLVLFINSLGSTDLYGKTYAEQEPTRVSRRFLQSFGRAHSLITQAKGWSEPFIGSKRGSSDLNTIRGIQWRFVIAYCGWEQATKALCLPQKLQNNFLVPHGAINPPSLTNRQMASIKAWVIQIDNTVCEVDVDEPSLDTQRLTDFLALNSNYHDFPLWLLGRDNSLSDAGKLAVLRNIVAHGSLSPSTADKWGLTSTYVEATRLVIRSFSELVHQITMSLEG